MPSVLLTLSDVVADDFDVPGKRLREIIASALDSRRRRLDDTHIALRIVRGKRQDMLGEIEIEVFAQWFLDRWRSRDARAHEIARRSCEATGYGCACWINLGTVGYSRATVDGRDFYSD